MITELTPDEVISYCRSALGLQPGTTIDTVLLASLLRRCAIAFCPCSRKVLRNIVTDGLSHLNSSDITLADQIDKIIKDMIVAGDLLESSDVTDPDANGTWVFAAPPSFAVRRSGNIYLIGIMPEQNSFLSASLESRIFYSGITRSIVPQPNENTTEILVTLGFKQISGSVWLKSPKSKNPKKFLASFEQQLSTAPACGFIQDIKILNPATEVTYYPGRWEKTKNQTGNFVIRRPQEFGAPIWSFAKLIDGSPQRVIDLPLANYRWRGCDAAWHLQMAIDYCRGQSQQYRKRKIGTDVCFDFFSPLPLWSQRRLTILGRQSTHKTSLFSYKLPMSEVAEEEKYLQEHLWLIPKKDKNIRNKYYVNN